VGIVKFSFRDRAGLPRLGYNFRGLSSEILGTARAPFLIIPTGRTYRRAAASWHLIPPGNAPFPAAPRIFRRHGLTQLRESLCPLLPAVLHLGLSRPLTALKCRGKTQLVPWRWTRSPLLQVLSSLVPLARDTAFWER